MAGEHLTGRYRVRAIRPAFDDANRLMRKSKDRAELRDHALKLRFWPGCDSANGGAVGDLDWTWVRSLPGLQIGELRIDDTIGGNDNLRILFYVGERVDGVPRPTIWVIRVLQKKRDDLSPNELAIAKARRTLVLERFYRNPL